MAAREKVESEGVNHFFFLTLVVAINSAHPVSDGQLYNPADEKIRSAWLIAMKLLLFIMARLKN